MKTYHFLTTVILSIVLIATASLKAIAQSPSNNDDKGGVSIRAFSIIHKAEKVYLNWKVKQESTDCVYVIERSEGNGPFKPVGIKEGFASPLTLLYSFVDKNSATSGNISYRLKKISADNKVMYFDPMTEGKTATPLLVVADNNMQSAIPVQQAELSIQ